MFAKLDLKSAKLGSARSNFITDLLKTLITMKLITKRSTDRLHLDSKGLSDIFLDEKAPHWVSLCFQPLLGVFGCRRLRGGLFVRFLGFFDDFRNSRVGHLECDYLIPHISNFSSKICNTDCLTLQPPRTVVCHPRQTRVDIHVLVVIIQGYCFSNMPFKELEQKLLPKKQFLIKNMLLPKNMKVANLAGFLGFYFKNGLLHWKTIWKSSNFRHLALYSKRFQTIILAPKLLAFCVTASI